MTPFKTLIVLVLMQVNALAFTLNAADNRGNTSPVLSAAIDGFAATNDEECPHSSEDFNFSSLLFNDDGTRPHWFHFKSPIAPLPVGSFAGRPVNVPPNMHLNIFSPPPEPGVC